MANLNDIQLKIIVEGVGIDNLQKASDVISKLNTGIRESADTAKAAKGKWDQFVDSMNKLEQKFDAVFRAASHLQALGSDLTGIGTAGIGVLEKSVDAWGDYEYELNRAAGALGIFDTLSPIYDDLQSGINKVAVEAKLFPAEEVAHGIYIWGAATGQVVKDQKDLDSVMSSVLPLLKLSAMTNTNLETAMKGVYQITQQYHLGMGDVARVTEDVFYAAQKTSLEVPDLINSFKFVGDMAPELGVKFEDVVQILSRLGDVGLRGSQSGRGLAQMFMKLVAPTNQGKKALDAAFMATDSLGASFNALVFPSGEFVGTTKYIDMMAQATEHMTQQERLHLLAVITTQNEARVLLPLIDQQIKARKDHTEAILQERVSLKGANEIFNQSWDILSNSWKGALGAMSNSLGVMVRLIGSSVADMVKPFLAGFTRILMAVSEFMQTHKEIVDWGVKFFAIVSIAVVVAGALFSVVGVALALGAGIAFVISGAVDFLRIFGGVGATLDEAAGSAKGVTGAITKSAAGVKTLGSIASKFLGPAALLITVFATNMGGMRDAVVHAVSAIIGFISKLHLSFDLLLGPMRALATVVTPLVTAGFAVLAGAIDIVAGLIEWLSKQKAVVTVIQMIMDGLMAIVGVTLAFKAASATIGAFTGTLNLLRNSFGLLKSAFGIVNSVIAFATGANLAAIATKAWGLATKIFTGVWKLLNIVFASSPIGAVLTGIILLAGLLYEAWTNDWFGIQEAVGDAFKVIQQAAGNIINTLIEVVSNLVGILASFPNPLQGWAQETQKSLDEMAAQVDTWGTEVTESTQSAMTAQGEMHLKYVNGTADLYQRHYTALEDMRQTDAREDANWQALKVENAKFNSGIAVAVAKDEQKQVLAAREAYKTRLNDQAAIMANYIPEHMKTARDLAKGLSAETMQGTVQSVYDNFDEVDTSWNAYIKHVKDPLDLTVQMSKIKSHLASKELQEGLASKNPLMRAEAEAQEKYLEGQLLALQTNAPIIALKTGQDYGDALSSNQSKLAADATIMTKRMMAHLDVVKGSSKDAGAAAGANFGSGVESKRTSVGDSASKLTSGATTHLKNYDNSTYTWGQNAASSFASGILSQGVNLANKAANYLKYGTKILQFQSPPEAGPWLNIDKWGIGAGEAFANGLVDSGHYLANSAARYLSSAQNVLSDSPFMNPQAQLNMNQTYDNERVIRIEVTSPDDSVNDKTVGQIKDIFTAEEFVSTLEHMATVS